MAKLLKQIGDTLVPIEGAELEQFLNDQAAAAVEFARERRNSLLAETDWRFRSDLTVSQEWIDYCQALRDVPAQEGFPENITWPIKPE
jgi:hypothetical protein